MAARENLPDVLSEFLKAIEEMSHTVLVPHRLVDIPEENELPTGNCHCSTSKDGSLVKPGKELNDSGLYGTYHMLLDIKEELTTGRKTSAEGCFRSHVKSVMESMKYLTWLAKSLTQNYCEEVSGGDSNGLRPNSFSFNTVGDLGKLNGVSAGLQLRGKPGEKGRRRTSST
ncbi:positive regulation of ligase [Desmophyllum pertusum]|uniref:Positive regulation of ligase n=1 Tax=Desmophyllum pertusum TaxID=174260 RepID=A0A9X0D7D7_9CNID|nr:positive regulation of ligase [Desmophyllum pertusum]